MRKKVGDTQQVPRLCLRTEKLRNMKVTAVPIVIDVLSTVTKGLVKGLEELEISSRMETN